jgi:hypothetical protein
VLEFFQITLLINAELANNATTGADIYAELLQLSILPSVSVVMSSSGFFNNAEEIVAVADRYG